jgi:hypothetical protein
MLRECCRACARPLPMGPEVSDDRRSKNQRDDTAFRGGAHSENWGANAVTSDIARRGDGGGAVSELGLNRARCAYVLCLKYILSSIPNLKLLKPI